MGQKSMELLMRGTMETAMFVSPFDALEHQIETNAYNQT
jgi:hypothetical protein